MGDAKRILAIETSGRHGSVATLWGEAEKVRLLEQIVLTGDERTAQALTPAIQRLLAAADWQPQSVELMAVAVGPGSFTGLRIGVTTAKAFAYAVGAEVIGVNTLAALAAQAPAPNSPLWTVLDAQRQEMFVAKFAVGAECDTFIMSQEGWIAGLKAGDAVVGPPLKRLAARLPEGVIVLRDEFWQPMAAGVGQVAWGAYRAGKRDDLWTLAPNYYRASAAEEKRMP